MCSSTCRQHQMRGANRRARKEQAGPDDLQNAALFGICDFRHKMAISISTSWVDYFSRVEDVLRVKTFL